jgi:hypothetical protein
VQQFTVPQFIDVEDKIIGPITTRQFLVMLTGFIVIGILYKIFDFSAFITFGLLIFALSGVFAFVKINGMPFHFFVLNFMETLTRPPLRVWNNLIGRAEKEFAEMEKTLAEERPALTARRFTTSRLTELALIVDTRGAYKGEGGAASNIFNRSEVNDSSA